MAGYNLPFDKPVWVLMQDEKALHSKVVSSRLAELKRQREWVNVEIELLEPTMKRLSPSYNHVPQADLTAGWQFSVTGFHNPKKHRGLSVDAFLELYKKRGKKKYLDYVIPHEEEVKAWLLDRFPKTLHNDPSGSSIEQLDH